MKKYMLVVLVGANMAFGVGNSPLVKPSQAKFRTQVVKTSNFDTAARLQDLELELAECSLKALKNPHPGQKVELEKKCAELKAEIDALKGGPKRYIALAKKGLIVAVLTGLVATGAYFYMTDTDANILKEALVKKDVDGKQNVATPVESGATTQGGNSTPSGVTNKPDNSSAITTEGTKDATDIEPTNVISDDNRVGTVHIGAREVGAIAVAGLAVLAAVCMSLAADI